MVFHHVANYLEFGGLEYCNLLGMAFGETRAPQYRCVFSIGDHEVHRVWYDELRSQERDKLPKVTKPWKQSDWPMKEWEAHREEDWMARRMRLYDGNGDGELDREERIAAGNFEDMGLERLESKHERLEVTFAVVERTVKIQVP